MQILFVHYGITDDEFLYSDYPKLHPAEFSIESFSQIAEMMKILYPIFCSEKALENPDFKIGYDYCCRILEATEHNEILRESMLNDCFSFFEKASEVTDTDGNIVVPEAVANMVWTIFQMRSHMGSEHILNMFHTPTFPITR